MKRRMLVGIAALLAGAGAARAAGAGPGAGDAASAGPAPAVEVQMAGPLDAPPPEPGPQETRPAEAAVLASLPDVNNYPELYSGIPIALEDVELQWKVVKEFDYYCLDLTVKEGERNRRAMERGEYIPPFLNRQRVTFVASPEIAREILDRTELDTAYPVKVWCTVGVSENLRRELGNTYWLARVERIDCYRGDRSVAWSIPSPEGAGIASPPAGPGIEQNAGGR